MHITDIATRFASSTCGPLDAEPLTGGNINRTFLIRGECTDSRGLSPFLVQQINRNVFPHPDQVMENLGHVSVHVAARIAERRETADRTWRIPQVIPTLEGALYHRDEDGEIWRALTYVGTATCFETIEKVAHAREAGAVLGHFHSMLTDFDGTLHDTLPGFHITPQYLASYDQALANGPADRREKPEAQNLIRFVESRRDLANVLEDAARRGELKQRIIHGDPKIANILIDDASGLGVGIIDLDTVKPGLLHYDFGDCVRSCCNPAGEETPDPTDAVIDLERVAGLAGGFLAEAGAALTAADRHYLYDSIRLITFELGLRFFADYLIGDTYFRTTYPTQNLHRAAVQMHLCKSIEDNADAIRKIVESS